VGVEIRQLRSFIAVAEELHFSRAAARLNLAQPSLSQQIRLLEASVRVPLIWRTSRQVELTAAGRAFLVEARATISQLERAVASAKAEAAANAQTVRLGFVDSAIYGIVPQLIRAYRDRRPEVQFSLRELPSEQQVQALSRAELDLGLVYPIRAGADIAFRPVRRERILLAMPRGHPLACRSTIPLSLLSSEALVSFERRLAPAVYDRVERMVRAAGASPRVVQQASELHTVLGMVAAGLGVALIPGSLERWAGDNVTCRRVMHPAPWVWMSLAWSRTRAGQLVTELIEAAMALGNPPATTSRAVATNPRTAADRSSARQAKATGSRADDGTIGL
jgi:DNA-binding transcriptional LysR family regulator